MQYFKKKKIKKINEKKILNEKKKYIIKYYKIFNSKVIKKKWNIKKKDHEKLSESFFKSYATHQFINLKYLRSIIDFFKKFKNYQLDKKKIELYNVLSNKSSVHSNFYFILFNKLAKCNFNKIKNEHCIENFYEINNFFNIFFKKYKQKLYIKQTNKIEFRNDKDNFYTDFFKNIFKVKKKINTIRINEVNSYFFIKFVYYIFFNFIKVSNFKKKIKNFNKASTNKNKIVNNKANKKIKNFWKVNNRFYTFNKKKWIFNLVYLNKKWVINNNNYSVYRFNNNINFFFFKYKHFKKNNIIKNKIKIFINYFFKKINNKNIFKIIFKKKINNFHIFKNYHFFNSKVIFNFIKNFYITKNNKFNNNFFFNFGYNNKNIFSKQNTNIYKYNFIYNKYCKNYKMKNNIYTFFFNNSNISNFFNSICFNNNGCDEFKINKSWFNSIISNKLYFNDSKKWVKIINKNWIITQDIKTKQFIKKDNFFNIINEKLCVKDYSESYKNTFFYKNKKYFKNNRNQYENYKNSLIFKDKAFYKDFFENYKNYEYLKNQKNKFFYINYIFIIINYNMFYIFKNFNKKVYFFDFTNSFVNQKVLSNTLIKQNKINQIKNKTLSYSISSFDKNKNVFTIYKNYKFNSKNFNMYGIYSIMYSRNYLNRRSIQVIVTPDKNNAYCSIIPYYKNYIRKKSRIYHKSVGSFCQKKGYMRRSRQTRKKFFEEAAFSLLRFSKKKIVIDTSFLKFIIFTQLLKKNLNIKRINILKKTFLNFFKNKFTIVIQLLALNFLKAKALTVEIKTLKQEKKKRKPFKKISF